MNEHSETFVQIFRDEAGGRLDEMTDALLALETGRAPDGAIDSLFRDAHSIKGGAGMLGLGDVRLLANAVEEVLAGARRTQSFPLELADPLLRATDRLRELVGGKTGPSVDLLEELARAQRLFSPVAAAEPSAISSPRVEERRMLRVPAAQIDRLLEDVGEAIVHHRGLEYQLGEAAGSTSQVDDGFGVVEQLLDDLKATAIEMRTLPLSSVLGPLPRMLRDLSTAAGKEAELVVSGGDTPLDRVILESLADLLGHLLRNAVGHGLESPAERLRAGKPPCGRVELRASHRGSSVEITVSDDGRGVSPEVLEEARRVGSLIEVLARPGYSTAGEVTQLSGRGVGLDAVKTRAESFGGSLDVRSEPTVGTTVTLVLPLALSLLSALLFERGANVFGVPLSAIDEVVTLVDTGRLEGQLEMHWREESIRVFDVSVLVGGTAPRLRDRPPALVLSAGGRRIAATCDVVIGEEEVVVKSLGSLAGTGGYLGGTILGDGRIALLLDPAVLVRGAAHGRVPEPIAGDTTQKILVVEDSFTVRELQRSILEAAGYRVTTARDGNDALAVLAREDDVDLVLTDLEMPELNGIDLTRAIRSQPSLAALPVVVVTSLGTDEDRQRGIEAGADAYMTKQSFDQRTLLDTIERLIGGR